MANSPAGPKPIRFGVFELDLSAGGLRKNGVKVKLQDQPLQILALLLERPGQVVSREELRKHLWPQDTFVDFDHSLNKAVNKLRDALEDSPEHPRFIETVPKRGYRFIAEACSGTPASREIPVPPTASAPVSPSTRTRRSFAAVGLAIAILMTAVFWVRKGSPFSTRAASASIHAIAVLPLRNLSGDPKQEDLAYGMTDALTTELSQISSIKVISRTSADRYRDSSKPLSQIAQELAVDGFVEGTVQKFGDSIRVTVQLIYAPEDRHLWAKSYEGDSRNVLALEQDVATAVAGEIGGTLTPSEKARLTRNKPLSLVSLEFFLQGRYHSEQAEALAYRNGQEKTRQSELTTARDLFDKAIHEDADYAQAYVGLAKTWRDESVSVQGPEKAEGLLRKAIQLDPELAEAYEALATLDVLRLWRWQDAEQEYRRAIELNPNSAEAHARYAEYLDCMSRFDEGMREFQRAQQLDPGHNFEPNPLFRRRQFQQAIALDEGKVQRRELGFFSRQDLAFDYSAAGRHEDAARQWEEMLRELGYADLADAMRKGREQSGYQGAYRALVAGLEAADAHGDPVPAFFPAIFYGILGKRDRAFYWLERGYRERSAAYSALNVDAYWDPLRSDPRFQDLVRRVGLPTR